MWRGVCTSGHLHYSSPSVTIAELKHHNVDVRFQTVRLLYIYIYIYIYVYVYVWLRTLADTVPYPTHVFLILYIKKFVCFLWRCGPVRAMASPFLRFLDHTQRRITVGRTPLDEWSAGRRDICLTTHNTHNRQISMPPVGFEPTISASERPQTFALDRVATGIGI